MRIFRMTNALAAGTAVMAMAESASAQLGLVVVAPAQQAAPAMSAGVIVLLAAGLCLFAYRRLGGSAAAGLAALGLLISADILSATNGGLLISGRKCGRRAEIIYDSDTPEPFTNGCDGPIQIEVLDPCFEDPCFGDNSSCSDTLDAAAELIPDPNTPLQPCQVGTVLATGEACLLPACGIVAP